MKFLIIGGASFIRSHLSKKQLNIYSETVSLDSYSADSEKNTLISKVTNALNPLFGTFYGRPLVIKQ